MTLNLQVLLWIPIRIIGHFAMALIIMGVDGEQQRKNVAPFANLIGVKVPNEIIKFPYDELIVQAHPNNEIHIAARLTEYKGKVDLQFLSKASNKLLFSVANYGHDLQQNSTIFEECQSELQNSLGNYCENYAETPSMVEWAIDCTDSISRKATHPNPDGFKVEHSEADRYVLEGLDEKLKAKGYSTNSILNVTFGPTKRASCNFKLIINSQIGVELMGSDTRKGNRDNILLLPREKVPAEYWEELFPPVPDTSTETPSTTTSAAPSNRKKTRWTFPPAGSTKVFGFMNN